MPSRFMGMGTSTVTLQDSHGVVWLGILEIVVSVYQESMTLGMVVLIVCFRVFAHCSPSGLESAKNKQTQQHEIVVDSSVPSLCNLLIFLQDNGGQNVIVLTHTSRLSLG